MTRSKRGLGGVYTLERLAIEAIAQVRPLPWLRRLRHVTVRFASQSDQSAASWGQAAFCPWRDANTSVSGPGRS